MIIFLKYNQNEFLNNQQFDIFHLVVLRKNRKFIMCLIFFVNLLQLSLINKLFSEDDSNLWDNVFNVLWGTL
jgi:hypothetical protein